MSSAPLYKVELNLHADLLAQYASQRGLSVGEVGRDPGYLVHAWLAETIGRETIACFRVMSYVPAVRVLAYSHRSAAELLDALQFNAQPTVYEILVDRKISGETMPSHWTA